MFHMCYLVMNSHKKGTLHWNVFDSHSALSMPIPKGNVQKHFFQSLALISSALVLFCFIARSKIYL